MKIESLPSWPHDLRDEERALLMLRAAQLRAKTDTTVEEAQVWLACFPVGELTFALPLERVRAAVPLRMVTSVPLAPSHVIGVLRFRGAIASVLSLASLLGVRGWKVDPAVLLVVDMNDDGSHVVAVDCEQIPRAISVPRAVIESARTARASARGEANGARGALTEVTLPDLTQLTILEDVARLLPDPRSASQRGKSAD